MVRHLEISSSIKNDGRIVLYAAACVVTAMVIALVSRDFGLMFFKYTATKTDRELSQALDEEISLLSKKTEDIATRPDLKERITEGDPENITEFLSQAKEGTMLDALSLADKDGMLLSRVPRFSNIGDNIFLTTAPGRVAAQGVATSMFNPGRNFPLTMSSVYPRLEQGKIAWALIAGYWFDDEYLSYLKNTYLTKGPVLYPKELIAYSKDDGVVGDTFSDTDTKQLIRMYLNNSSSYISDGKSGDVVHFNGKDYVLTNHLLSGPDGILGGVLVLTPLPSKVLWRSLCGGITVALLFFFGAASIENLTFKNYTGRKKRRTLLFLGVGSFGMLLVVWSGLYIHANRIIDRLDVPGFRIYNSKLKLSPESGVFALGYPQQMSVVLRSGGESVNAIESDLRYDPSVIRVDHISTSRSVCGKDYFLEQEIDNEAGVIRISCAIPGGYVDVRGIVADIIFTPISRGETFFSFEEGTKVLANDGLATDVLRAFTGSYYRVLPKENFNSSFSKDSVVIPFSSTHENSAKWYSSRDVKVGWISQEGVEYLYDFDATSTSVMPSPKKTSSSNLLLHAPTDGIYYFKIAPLQNGVQGSTTLLKIKIDTTSPEIPLIKASSQEVHTDEMVRFQFESSDDLSGAQKNFYISVDGSINLPTTPQLYMPFNMAGDHVVKVRVYDNAENYSEASTVIHVTKE
jgi:hypothetical protein